jgi:hypothetical protein
LRRRAEPREVAGDRFRPAGLGPADDVELAVESLGKTFAPIEPRAVVI